MQIIPNTHVFQPRTITATHADLAAMGPGCLQGGAPAAPKVTPAMIRKADEKLQKVAVNIILDHPFFAVLLLRQNRVADPSVKTCVTDGKTLRYNPQWVADLKPETAKFTLLSEVLHCVLHHNTRRNGRDKKQWDQACDYKVNQTLKDSGFDLPPDAPFDPSYDDLSAEQLYAKLYVEPPEGGGPGGGNDPDGEPGDQPPPPGGSDGAGGYGDVEDSPAESPAEIAQEEAEQDIATQQAAQCAKSQGKLPGALAKMLLELLEPKVDWKDELREFIQAHLGKDDQTWNRVNRRFVGGGDYLPGYQSETLPPFVVAFDTSGSVSDNELAQMNGELNKIMSDFPGTKATAVYCDARITDVIEYSEEVPFGTVKPKIGRGGTDFDPPFEWVRENMPEDPAALIYFTDMESSFPRVEPPYPVLWISTQKHYSKPHFGRVVVMEKQ
jgi:predicted metal-dependent peptidase